MQFKGLEYANQVLCHPRMVKKAYLEELHKFLTKMKAVCTKNGVDYVQDLLLGTLDANGQATPVDLVALERWQVPDLAEIAVVSGDPLDLGEVYAPAPPAKVPVPVPPDVC